MAGMIIFASTHRVSLPWPHLLNTLSHCLRQNPDVQAIRLVGPKGLVVQSLAPSGSSGFQLAAAKHDMVAMASCRQLFVYWHGPHSCATSVGELILAQRSMDEQISCVHFMKGQPQMGEVSPGWLIACMFTSRNWKCCPVMLGP